MPSPYIPSPVVLPASITEMDDGDPRTAASVTQITRPIADGLLYVMQNAAPMSQVDLTVPGLTVVQAPNGAQFARVEICGGGGGGGGGANFAPADTHLSGGGGGGGAMLVDNMFPVVSLRNYNVTIGAGGVGGAAAGYGQKGDDSFVVDSVTLVEMVRARGAQGGDLGQQCTAGSGPNQTTWGLGGGPTGFVIDPATDTTTALAANLYKDQIPQRGGHGVTGNIASYAAIGRGHYGPRQTFNGIAINPGLSGTPNATSSGSYRGGGSGGGGGAGAFGSGANGGNGGAPNNAGPAGNGTAGASAAGNGGGGGGGGGASGASNTSGTGGVGGDGGQGRARITWFGKKIL